MAQVITMLQSNTYVEVDVQDKSKDYLFGLEGLESDMF